MSGRDPAKEMYWRERVDEQRESGLTVREYCEGRGVNPGTFAWWKRELKRRDSQGQAANPPLFLPVHVKQPTLQHSPTIDVILNSGRQLRVRPGFDVSTLVELVDILEDR